MKTNSKSKATVLTREDHLVASFTATDGPIPLAKLLGAAIGYGLTSEDPNEFIIATQLDSFVQRLLADYTADRPTRH